MTNSSGIVRPYTVLLIEDNLGQARLTEIALRDANTSQFRMEHVENLSKALARIADGGIDIVLVDLTLPDSDPETTFQRVCAAAGSLPIVVLTGFDDEEFALEMLKAGAQDYIVKDEIQPKPLVRSLRYAIERKRSQSIETANQELEKAKLSLSRTVKRLENANEDLRSFTYFFGHDLQEPIRNLVFFANELEADLGEECTDRTRDDLKYITDSARRVQGMIQSLLTLSRAREAVLQKEKVNLSDCFADATRCLQARIIETGADVAGESLPTVEGDNTLLTLVFQNLIGNALKFSEGKSPVIRVTSQQSGDMWLIGVRDNGIGIPSDKAELVFAPFQRLCSRKKFEGTGIGLAVCKKVIERHGGRIWVESAVGEGAHFKFTLPMQVSAREGRPGGALDFTSESNASRTPHLVDLEA